MPRNRRLALLALMTVVVPLLGVSGYALYLHSDCHRKEIIAELERFFQLPCDVESIRGLTESGRTFEGVSIWLPGRRDRVFQCRSAAFRATDAGRPRRLNLQAGRLNLGSELWQKEDFRQIFKPRLGYELAPLRLERIDLEDFSLAFSRGGLSIHCDKARGRIELEADGSGAAHLYAYRINDRDVDSGVRIEARFDASNGLNVSYIELSLPPVELSGLGLDGLLDGAMQGGSAPPNQTAGQFAGSLEYHADLEGEPRIMLRGELRDTGLAALTGRLPCGPLEGRLDIQVDHARLQRRTITHLRGRGRIASLQLEPLSKISGWEGLSGTAALNLDAVDLALGHVRRLRLEGRAEGLPLERMLRPWGGGAAEGLVDVRIYNLDVVDDAIQSADVEINVHPPEGRPGLISRELLLDLAQNLFHFSWPEYLPENMLPERLEYSQMGVRLLVRDNRLRILGTHGDSDQTILTIRVFGRELGLVNERGGTIDLSPHVERLLSTLRTYDPRDVKKWLDK